MKGWNFDPLRTRSRLRASLRRIAEALKAVDAESYAPEAVYRVDSEAGEILDKARSQTEIERKILAALEAAHGDSEGFVYGPKFWPESVVYELESSAGTILLRRTFRIDKAGEVKKLGDAEEVEQVYRLKESAETTAKVEAGVSDCVAVVGAEAIGDSGTAELKLIEVGQGANGFYSADTLRAAAGPSGAFPERTKMYWDHPTPTEARERPERSLKTLAGELTGPATFRDGALWAPAKIFKPFREAVSELKNSIGVSIRAKIRKLQGPEGPFIDAIVPDPINSVDFVTLPGAGGKVVEAFESWGRGPQPDPIEQQKEPDAMETEALQQVQESLTAIADTLKAHGEQLKRVDSLADRLGRQEIRAAARTAVESSKLPAIAQTRIVEQLVSNPPTNADGSLDQEAFTASAQKAIEAEGDYIKQLGPGEVKGLGGETPAAESGADQKAADLELSNSFAGFPGVNQESADNAACYKRPANAKEVN